MSEEKCSSNRVSFYIYTDVLSEGVCDINNSKSGYLLPYEDEIYIEEEDE